MPTPGEITAQLTGRGGPFEVVTEEVAGRPTEVYKERMRSLREIPAVARGRGDGDPFIVYGDQRVGFTTFVDSANSVSAALSERFGIEHGDRVAVLAQNCPEWCLAFWGTVDLGAVLVGLNGWWKSDEIVYGLQDSGAKVLVTDRKRVARIVHDLDECPELEHVFLIDCDPGDIGLADDERIHRFEQLTAAPSAEFPTTPIDEDDPAVILYTSGTTGRPKGAVSTHRNMIANLQNTFYSSVYGMLVSGEELIPTAGGQSVSLFTSPLFHVSGCHSTLVVGLLAGLRLVMVDGRFDPTTALELIEQEGVGIWATVPTMVWRVCEHPKRHDFDTTTVRTVAFGGSPSADELQRMVRETFPNVRAASNVYGLTESSSAATILSAGEALARPDTVGRAVPTVHLRIVDALGNDLPNGEPGEVLISGPTIMAGYWGKPEATAEAIDGDGWLHTGDIGTLDDEGYLTITDRKKDMIIRGGENIYCVEIENRLVERPDVLDAAVIGVPHGELGEEVKAVVQIAPGSRLSEDDIRTWVKEALADFKVPTYVELRTDKLPRNASGKLLKNALRGVGEVSFEETM